MEPQKGAEMISKQDGNDSGKTGIWAKGRPRLYFFHSLDGFGDVVFV